MPALISFMIWLLMAMPAMAHGDEPHGAGYPWTFDPWIVVPLAVFAALYALGATRLLWRSKKFRSVAIRASLCLAGLLALAGALLSPLHWLGEHLFSFHMIEHEIVMAVAAPLIVMARPVGAILWCLPRTIRRAATVGLHRGAGLRRARFGIGFERRHGRIEARHLVACQTLLDLAPRRGWRLLPVVRGPDTFLCHEPSSRPSSGTNPPNSHRGTMFRCDVRMSVR